MQLTDDHQLRSRLAAGLAGSTASLPGEAWVAPSPETLAGVFPQLEVIELIGQGGMGAVYKARQTHLDRLVALKLLDPRLSRDPTFAGRFRREALALARLTHPHIVALHDVGEADGWQYLLMEYIDGANLRQTLRTGRFSPDETLHLIPQLCDALAYAHGMGIVHRDLKPENILIDSTGQAHIADFGLAKISGDTGSDNITRSGQMIGTAAYMAPEQMAGAASIDHRADLYALGVVFYEMLTGQLPLGRFEPPSHRAQVDARVDDVVLRALERAPEQRWQSAAEVGRAIGDLNAHRAPALSAQPPRRAASWAANLSIIFFGSLALILTAYLKGHTLWNAEVPHSFSSMMDWWSSLSTALQAFYIIAFLGTGVALVQSLFMLLGIGMHELPAAEIPHGDGLTEHGSGLQALSLRTITAFLTGFGWVGVVTLASGGALHLAVPLALIAGLAFARLLLWLMSSMYRLGHDGSVNYANAVGHVGTVYLSIPEGNSAGGQVELLVQGRMAMVSAISHGAVSIRPGTKIRVVGLADRTTLIVTPL
jgi:serine/threonine protein kinase